MDAKARPEKTCLSDLPTPEEVRRQIADNIRERQALRQLLRASEQALSLSTSRKPEATQ